MPLAQQLNEPRDAGRVPTASSLDRLTASLDNTGAIQQLMALLFNGASAANGFDSLGHYVRDEPLVATAPAYATTPVPGCSANFTVGRASAAADAQAASRPATRRARHTREQRARPRPPSGPRQPHRRAPSSGCSAT